MRTTITIDEHLLVRVKQRAAATGRTSSQVIEDAVRESLLRQEERPGQRFKVRGWHGGPAMPGVDLDSNVALLDFMERRG